MSGSRLFSYQLLSQATKPSSSLLSVSAARQDLPCTAQRRRSRISEPLHRIHQLPRHRGRGTCDGRVGHIRVVLGQVVARPDITLSGASAQLSQHETMKSFMYATCSGYKQSRPWAN